MRAFLYGKLSFFWVAKNSVVSECRRDPRFLGLFFGGHLGTTPQKKKKPDLTENVLHIFRILYLGPWFTMQKNCVAVLQISLILQCNVQQKIFQKNKNKKQKHVYICTYENPSNAGDTTKGLSLMRMTFFSPTDLPTFPSSKKTTDSTGVEVF